MPSNQHNVWLIVFLTIFALAVGITTGRKLQDEPQSAPVSSTAPSNLPGYISDPAHHQTHDPLWPQIADVAEHFLCGCGDCGDMGLLECVCDMPNGGIREKNFIRQQLTAGHPVERVVTMVEERFGRRIAETVDVPQLPTVMPPTDG